MGMGKVLLFVKSIDQRERMAIRLKLNEDDSANRPTKDWTKVERECRLHDEGKTRFSSAITRPTRNGEGRTGCNYTLPPKEESLKTEVSTAFDIEVVMREAFKNLKVQVEAEEKLKMETKPRRTVIEEEETSQQIWINDAANMKAQV